MVEDFQEWYCWNHGNSIFQLETSGFHGGYANSYSHQQWIKGSFPTFSPAFGIVCFLDGSHSDLVRCSLKAVSVFSVAAGIKYF